MRIQAVIRAGDRSEYPGGDQGDRSEYPDVSRSPTIARGVPRGGCGRDAAWRGGGYVPARLPGGLTGVGARARRRGARGGRASTLSGAPSSWRAVASLLAIDRHLIDLGCGTDPTATTATAAMSGGACARGARARVGLGSGPRARRFASAVTAPALGGAERWRRRGAARGAGGSVRAAPSTRARRAPGEPPRRRRLRDVLRLRGGAVQSRRRLQVQPRRRRVRGALHGLLRVRRARPLRPRLPRAAPARRPRAAEAAPTARRPQVRLRNGGRRGPQRRDTGLGGYSTGYYNRGYGGDRSPSRSRSRSRRRRSRRRRDDSDDSGRGRSRRRRGGSRRRRDDSRSASRSDRSASGASSRSGRSGGDVAGEREDEVPCVPCENAAEKKEDPVEELRAS